MKNRKPYGTKTELKDLRRATYSIAAAINNARIGVGVSTPLNCFIENIPDYNSGDEQLDLVHWGKVYRRVYRKARRYGVPIDSIWIRNEVKTLEH
jgi:hypothetical protein